MKPGRGRVGDCSGDARGRHRVRDGPAHVRPPAALRGTAHPKVDPAAPMLVLIEEATFGQEEKKWGSQLSRVNLFSGVFCDEGRSGRFFYAKYTHR